MNAPVRPWQGTTLAVFSFIGAALLILSGFMMIFVQGMIMSFMGNPEFSEGFNTGEITPEEMEMLNSMGGAEGMLGMLGAILIPLGIAFLLIGVLYIFVGLGLIKGKKWTLVATFILSGLQVLTLSPITIAFMIFFIVLAVMAWNDPYSGGESKNTPPHIPPNTPPNPSNA